MSTSTNTKSDDGDEPHEDDGGQQEMEAERRRSKCMLDGGVRQDENGHVHHDNSKDFVVRDGFPALRLPTDKKNDSSSSRSAVDKESSTTNINNKKKNVWWIDGDNPIPRTSFWAHEACFKFDAKQLPILLRDSKHVFSARTREDGQAYSTGTTYFVPAIMKPRCALEAMALEVFQRHTRYLPEGVVIPEQSGAEWWTLVLNDENNADIINTDDDDDDIHKASAGMKMRDPTAAATTCSENNNNSGVEEESVVDDDEVGLHFDADYGLEEQVPNLLLHPRLATVTYLTSTGAPTVVFDCQSPHSRRQREGPEQNNKAAAKAKSNIDNDTDDDAIMLSWHGTRVRKVWISHPKVGKHIAFDGRLLHGAPATFFPPADAFIHEKKMRKVPPILSDQKEDKPPPAKRTKRSIAEQEEGEENQLYEKQRITFLVNIWINHCPLDAEPLDEEICEQLETPWDCWSPPQRLSSSKEKKAQLDTDAANKQDGETNKVTASATTKTTPAFKWNEDVRFDKPPIMESAQLQKWSSIKDDDRQLLEPAGEEEVVICNRLVTVKYESTMDDLHQATAMAGLVEMSFEEGALVIQVGEKVESEEDDDEDDDDECGNDNNKDTDQKQAAID